MNLFFPKTTWLHFIGGHYKSIGHFVREAEKIGISRRVPANVANAMNYGDTVKLLRWEHGAARYFADMVITGIILPHDIAQQVGEALKAEGKAEFSGGSGAIIQRECGWFVDLGSWRVNASMPEILAKAQELAGNDPLFMMISGKLVATLKTPQPVEQKFTRGFVRMKDKVSFHTVPEKLGTMTMIADYHQGAIATA